MRHQTAAATAASGGSNISPTAAPGSLVSFLSCESDERHQDSESLAGGLGRTRHELLPQELLGTHPPRSEARRREILVQSRI